MEFSLNLGERVGIVGPNGAGKSTLFKLAMGLNRPDRGEVRGLGKICSKEKDFRRLRTKVGYLFQDPEDQLFCATVAEDVAFGPLNLGKTRSEALEITSRVLKQVGLEGFEKRVTYQLSGGEKQLVALASVLAMEPMALLLDEPSTGLDLEHKKQLLKILNASDLSWAMVSHEQDFLEQTCTSLIYLNHGLFQPFPCAGHAA
ncbi:energy-coupling factor ABC transporter ATP-binding protein [Dethiosulfatarculus sandiegensis]|nr:ABC transporter ATP-binding protein [Dethiosulfatarculus sandiegensis]